MKKILLATLVVASLFTSCKEHFSDGERVGTVTKFSKAGVFWDSWDGRLNITQTGMNSSGEPFTFSIDNDRNDQQKLIDTNREVLQIMKTKAKEREQQMLEIAKMERELDKMLTDDVQNSYIDGGDETSVHLSELIE